MIAEMRDRPAPMRMAGLFAAVAGLGFGLPGCYAV